MSASYHATGAAAVRVAEDKTKAAQTSRPRGAGTVGAGVLLFFANLGSAGGISRLDVIVAWVNVTKVARAMNRAGRLLHRPWVPEARELAPVSWVGAARRDAIYPVAGQGVLEVRLPCQHAYCLPLTCYGNRTGSGSPRACRTAVATTDALSWKTSR